MKYRSFLLMAFVACVLGAAGATGGYQFRHLPSDRQLTSKLINTIYQDEDGFVYFGTASGLDRYDGYRIKSYVRDDSDTTSLHDGYVEQIQRAPDGRLWILAGGTYSIFDQRIDRFCRDMKPVFASMGMEHTPSLVLFGGDGSCWMWVSGVGLFRSRNGVAHKIDDPDGHFSAAQIDRLIEVSPERVLTSDRTGCLTFVDVRTSRICATSRVPEAIRHTNRVYTPYVDREGLIWVFCEAGLWILNPATGLWSDTMAGVRLPQGNIKAMMQDRQGRMWIGFDHDGMAVMEKDGTISRVTSDASDDRSLSSNTITAITEDRTGSIWVGSRKSGVSVYNDAAFKFGYASFPDINCIVAADDGDVLWLGTDSSGLIRWDRKNDVSQQINTARPGCQPDAIVTLASAPDGTLWGGTYGGGLLHISRDGRVTRKTAADGLACDNIWAIEPMSDGTLLLGTLGCGLQHYDPLSRKSTILNVANSDIHSDYVSTICRAADSLYYVGTSDGVAIYNSTTGTIRHTYGNRRGTQRFSNANLNQLFLDSRGLLWVASREGLDVYDAVNDTIYRVPIVPERSFVLGLAEDSNHTMWVSIGAQLMSVAFSLGDNGVPSFGITRYDSSDGLQLCDFNQRSLATLPDGSMMIGGFNGVNHFRPDALKISATAPRVFFTDLSLFGEYVRVGREYGGRVLLPERITDVDKIELSHSSNEFAVSIATDDYVKPEKTTYYYRLDGFSDSWQRLPDNTRRISYTNLAPGRYTLHVKALNGDGVYSANEASLGIFIRPPFYATPLAKALYLILIVLLVVGSYMYIRSHERRLSRRRERVEAARRQEELDQLRFRFFTNVSHELRTPLTLITAPLESLLHRDFDTDTRDKLEMIQDNANHLLGMVDQLLDFRKNEVAGHQLNLSQGDIVRFVRSISDSFRSLSEKKHIHLTFFSAVPSLTMEFDEDKMGKIVKNLLSNAFKFTPENGRVDVSVQQADGQLELTIADTGCGISDEDKQRIFERFYQAAGNSASSGGGGTGIGLSLVTEFVRLHGGSVAVADNAVRGAVFTVRIPVRGASIGSAHGDERPAGGAGAPPAGAGSGMPRLLVVDDNPDLLRFIASELNGEYAVVTASDGREALKEVAEYVPDIIVSDLMMPVMDGIELCRRLKGYPATASIPLLILTAKHEVATKIEGLTLGADDYMTKPFNIDVLRLRLKKLLDLRGRGVRRALIEPEPQSLNITSLDEMLIEKAVKYVDENMSKTELSVEELAAGLGMSRVHLYKRLKAITGKTPIEFIRLLRLKRAAQLLRESQLNISEIAYRCGFNNPKYFSKYFKEEFGVLPSVYQESEGK